MNNNDSVQNLIEALDNILYDSKVFIFGVNEGEYLEELKKYICTENTVLIFEPNYEKYSRSKYLIDDSRIKLLYSKDEVIESTIKNAINFRSFNRLWVHSYANYEEEYSEEYKTLIKYIDNAYFAALSDITVSHEFKALLLENTISNLNKINDSTQINQYIDINKDVPAIIVSAGPSLDKNIEIMLKYKEKLKNFFIICGNRTLGSLLEKGIVPNLVISIDSQYITYEMTQKYFEYKIPLAYNEESNKELLKGYKGEIIYIGKSLPLIIEELKECKALYTGGSVAHTCTDFARLMGCNPIIFVGQDLAYTFNKDHSDISSFPIDKNKKTSTLFMTKDINGDDINTTFILNYYKIKFEEYIRTIKKSNNVKFYNCSYGADIIGAPHIELEEILKSLDYKNEVVELLPKKNINIDSDKILSSMKNDIDKFIEKSKICIEICTELRSKDISIPMTEIKEEDETLQKFIEVLKTVYEFENSKLAKIAWGYVEDFVFEMIESTFNMTAKEYYKLTSDIKYQSNNLKKYFTKLLYVLEKIDNIFSNAYNK